jgi:hypothetical protein
MHRVVFDGQYVHLPDHPDLERDYLYFELGAEIRCLQVREAWRRLTPLQQSTRRFDPHMNEAWCRQMRAVLPACFRKAFDDWRVARSMARHELRCLHIKQRLEHMRLNPGAIAKTESAVTQALCLAKYNYRPVQTSNIWVQVEPGDPEVYLDSVPTTSTFRRVGRKARQSTSVGTLRVQVGPGWYGRVYQRGLALVDRKLILAVLTEADIDYRQRLKASGKSAAAPWWVESFGEHPDLSKGTCVLVLGTIETYRCQLRCARVVEGQNSDGAPIRFLEYCD